MVHNGLWKSSHGSSVTLFSLSEISELILHGPISARETCFAVVHSALRHNRPTVYRSLHLNQPVLTRTMSVLVGISLRQFLQSDTISDQIHRTLCRPQASGKNLSNLSVTSKAISNKKCKKQKLYFTCRKGQLYRSIRHGSRVFASNDSSHTSVLGIEPWIYTWFAIALPTALLRRFSDKSLLMAMSWAAVCSLSSNSWVAQSRATKLTVKFPQQSRQLALNLAI